LEGDSISSLYSHRQALVVSLESSVMLVMCLLFEFDSHVVPCASRLDSELVKDTGAGTYPSWSEPPHPSW